MHPALKKYLQDRILLSSQQEQLVSDCFKPLYTKRNQILLPKGAIARYIYFVVKGCLRVFLPTEDGSESTRFLIFEGRMGTAFPSFILQQPSQAAIQTLEASHLLMLSHADRQRLYQEVPGWETMDRKGIELDYIASIERIEGFITMDAKARYDSLMQQHPQMLQRLPAKIIADYLGISGETLSRLKSKR
jgi:CRP-like cAMP-binding protein